jgi:hypothetical protein
VATREGERESVLVRSKYMRTSACVRRPCSMMWYDVLSAGLKQVPPPLMCNMASRPTWHVASGCVVHNTRALESNDTMEMTSLASACRRTCKKLLTAPFRCRQGAPVCNTTVHYVSNETPEQTQQQQKHIYKNKSTYIHAHNREFLHMWACKHKTQTNNHTYAQTSPTMELLSSRTKTTW